MYRETAQKILGKLRSFNYKTLTDFGVDFETEQLISAITNECKSTVMHKDYDNSSYIRKYESMISKDAVKNIVRQ